MKYTIAVGSPVDGFTLNDIFDTQEEAIESAESVYAEESWWVMTIFEESDYEEVDDELKRRLVVIDSTEPEWDLNGSADARFVVFDIDTDEVLSRGFVSFDDAVKEIDRLHREDMEVEA